MKRSSRLLALLLTLAMVLALMPTVVFAEGELGDLTGKTVILHTNDVHGAIDAYASVAGLKAQYEAAGADVILTDAGDYSQGTPYVSASKGANAVAMMNEVGYDIATLGNHEFDYGYAQLAENLESAKFQVLCADVFDAEGNTIYDATCMVEKDGVKIGFIGLETPEAQTKANPALIKGLRFAAEEEMYKIATDAAADLKEQGADVVICLAHLGVDDSSEPNRSVDLYENTEGIDFIIDGHSHTVMTEGENGEPIQSTGSSLENVGCIVIDEATGAIEDNYLIPLDETTPADEDVAAAAQKIIDEINDAYGQVFAKTEVDLDGEKAHVRTDDTNMGNLITDAMLWTATKEEGSVDVPAENIVVITNGGGIRASIKKGDITKKDINTVLPFGNTVAVVYVTGEQLLEALEASTYCSPESLGGFPQIAGMEITVRTAYGFDQGEQYPGSTYYAPASIRRVTINSIGGKAFDPKATYAVVTNNFVAAGGDTYYVFGSSDKQFDTGIPMDEAVMDYITEVLDGVVGQDYAEAQDRVVYNDRYYDDVPTDSYYADAIETLTEAGMINGYGDFVFGPEDKLTRGQLATILFRGFGPADEGAAMGSELYSDVPAGSYYDEAIGALTELGILYGVGGGKFEPDAPVTREQLAAILYRTAQVLEALGIDIIANDDVDGYPDIIAAEDFDSISSYAIVGLNWCVDSEIIYGTSEDALVINPKGNATRGEAATMIYRFGNLMEFEEPAA